LVTIWDATDSSTRRATTEHITSDTDPRFLDSVSEVHRLDANPAHPLVAAADYPELGAGGAFTAIVWDTDTGEQVFAVRHDDPVSDVAWSGDGELLASSDLGGVIRVVDRSGTEVAVLRDEQDRPIEVLQFSPDGRHIIATTRTEQAGHVSIWDWERSEVVHVIEDHRFPQAFAFDADGGRVVIADGEGYAAVWDTASWTQLTTFTGHAGPVEAVDVAPDGRSVATAGAAGTVRLWDMATGAERLTLEGHGGIVWDLAFSPDGTRLASVGDDGQVRVWALDVDDLIGIAKDKLTRGLTDAECREYLHVDECPAE
jgi:WD40 repeat protein